MSSFEPSIGSAEPRQRPGWVTRSYPAEIEFGLPLTDGAYRAAVYLFGALERVPGDLVEIVHRDFCRLIGRTSERSSRRAFDDLQQLGVVARRFTKLGRRGYSLYLLLDPHEAHQRRGLGLAAVDPQLLLPFAEEELSAFAREPLAAGVFRLYVGMADGGGKAAPAPLFRCGESDKCGACAAFPQINAAHAPHLFSTPASDERPEEKIPGKIHEDATGPATGPGGTDPGEDPSAIESTTGQGIEAACATAPRGDRSQWTAGGDRSARPADPPSPPHHPQPDHGRQRQSGTPRASRGHARHQHQQQEPFNHQYQPLAQAPAQAPSVQGSIPKVGDALPAAAGAIDVDRLIASSQAVGDARYRRIHSRLVAAIRTAEERAGISTGNPKCMRGTWPVDAWAKLVCEDSCDDIDEEVVGELVRYLETHRIGNPFGCVVSWLRRYETPGKRRSKPR